MPRGWHPKNSGRGRSGRRNAVTVIPGMAVHARKDKLVLWVQGDATVSSMQVSFAAFRYHGRCLYSSWDNRTRSMNALDLTTSIFLISSASTVKQYRQLCVTASSQLMMAVNHSWGARARSMAALDLATNTLLTVQVPSVPRRLRPHIAWELEDAMARPAFDEAMAYVATLVRVGQVPQDSVLTTEEVDRMAVLEVLSDAPPEESLRLPMRRLNFNDLL